MSKRYRLLQEKYFRLEEDYQELLRVQQDLMTELRQLRSDREAVKKSREEMHLLHENARRLKHDMRNHLMAITGYLNEKKIEDARNYTSEILDKLNLEYAYIATGNTLINFIVNQKFALAKEKGIFVKAEIENLRFGKIRKADFSAILANLLDNAIEAAEESAKPYVELVIRRIKGYEVIKISNSIDKSVLKSNPELKTTKADKASHGVGIIEIREIVEKYEGIMDIYEEDDRFIVSVML